jgi:uncharacterized caspase-like protein
MPDHAIIVGINQYAELQDLEGAVHDAEDFRDWIISPGGGGLDAQNVAFIQTPADWSPADPQPDRLVLDNALRDLLAKALAGPRPIGNRLFLFVSGHGFNDPNKDEEVALYSSETRSLLPAYLAVTWYARLFKRLRAFEQIALIMDCCRDVSPAFSIQEPQHMQTLPHSEAHRVKWFTAFATGFGMSSRERLQPGTNRKAGIFSTALMEALDKAPPNIGGRLTGSQVEDFIHNNMSLGQTAKIDADSHQEFVFHYDHQAGTFPVQITLDPFSGGEKIVIDTGSSNDPDRREVAAEFAQMSVPLPPGLFRVTISGTNRKCLIEVPTNEPVIL